ncbi:MAG: polysaccharide deacetylase family protein, partial [Parafilimonas sp.]
AKATFFSIGKNIVGHPEIYRRIIDEGHRPGNHTYNHVNGWKTSDKKYISNVFEAARHIDSDLFRPPYGRITKFQAKVLQGETGNRQSAIGNQQSAISNRQFKIIMWDVLSGDFDEKISPEQCFQNVILNTKPGSIVVFHDSTKAWERIKVALPKVLDYYTKQGYGFDMIK